MINEKLLKKANSGDLDAILEVGDAYYFGRDVEEDDAAAGVWYRKAFALEPENARVLNSMGNICHQEKNELLSMQYYRKSAVMGYTSAQYNYAKGLRARGDEECIAWYEKAYQNGDSDAADQIGRMYLDGELVEKDAARGIKYLQRAIDMGNTDAMIGLSYYYIETEEEKSHALMGIQLLEQAAELGDGVAAENLAVYYRYGNAVPKDLEKSVAWARRAAELGEYSQLYYTGLLTVRGEEEMPLTAEEGLRLMEEGYDRGEKDAAIDLANYYRNGEYDAEKAVFWLERAIRSGEKWEYSSLRKLYAEIDGETAGSRYLAFLQERCDAGDTMAMTRLAEAYLKGEDVPADWELSMDWFDRGIAAGDPYAVYSKACALADAPQGDKKEALSLFIRAAEAGDNGAQHQLGCIYYEGELTPQDVPQAIRWLEAAEKNHMPLALYDLGRIYHDKALDVYDPYKALTCFKAAWESTHMSQAAGSAADMLRIGEEIPQDGEEAVKYYRYAAEAGDCFGYSGLMLCYLGGIGVEKDREKAKECLLKAKELGYAPSDVLTNILSTPEDRFAEMLEKAKAGDAESQYQVYQAYRKGEGVAENREEAVKWCRLAAKQGHTQAQAQMGLLEFFDGHISTAVWYLNQAADGGHTRAMTFLAEMYDTGNDVIVVDHQKAFLLYMRAAEAGDPEGMHAVGVDYNMGEGVAQNKSKAFEWFKKGADLGHAKSMAKVGYCYISGAGVPEDDAMAYHWLKKAVENGYDDAKDVLADLEKMHPEWAGGNIPQSAPKKQPHAETAGKPEDLPKKQPEPAASLACPHCGAAFPGKKLPAGRTLSLTCPRCSGSFTVKDGKVVQTAAPSDGNSPALSCPGCGTKIRLKNAPLGKKITFTCPKCGRQQTLTFSPETTGNKQETPRGKTVKIPFGTVTTYKDGEGPAEFGDIFSSIFGSGTQKDAAAAPAPAAPVQPDAAALQAAALASQYLQSGDDQKAFAFAEEAAEKGHVESMGLLGCLYAIGRGTERNPRMSRYWLEKAFSLGYNDDDARDVLRDVNEILALMDEQERQERRQIKKDIRKQVRDARFGED